MEGSFDTGVLLAYSAILTYVIDFLSKIPKVGTYIVGWVKQLIAALVGVGYCVLSNVNVFENNDSLSAKVLTGIILAAVAGFGWSKVAGILSSTKTKLEGSTCSQ